MALAPPKRAALLWRAVLGVLVVSVPIPARAGLDAAFAAHPEGAVLRALWLEAQQLERDDDLPASSERFRRVVQALPDRPEPLWRLARNTWRLAERLPAEQKKARLAQFGAAEELARRGLELEPRCAECMFWRAAALGRITTTQGVIQSARYAPVIAELFDRAIALRPTHRDGDDNTTLGNLYHASAAFYRLVPEWLWLSWLLGVRGDKERSVEYSRRAVAISPRRLDYQVELGAGLLCLGTSRHRQDLVREGREVLRQSQSLAPLVETRIDMVHARILIEQPERACSWARDGWIELDEEQLRSTGGDLAADAG